MGALGTVVVVALLVNAPSEVVARTGAAGGQGSGVEEIRVRCGAWGTSGRSDWGAAAGVVCQDAAPRRVVIAGLVAVVAGASMLYLTWQRPWHTPERGRAALVRRAERAAASVLVALGLSAAGGGLAVQLVPDQVTRLTTDDETLTGALPDSEVVASFEVVGFSALQGGRYEEELWLIVETPTLGGEDIDAVVGALGEIGWSVEAVPLDNRGGWVAFRGLAGEGSVDQVEIGLLRHAGSPAAEISENARRMLDTAVPPGTEAVAIHVSPSPLAT